jgi:MFS family permease
MHPGGRPLENDTARIQRRLVVRRGLVVAAAMVSMFIVTIETTIVSAIIPVSTTQTELSQSRWVVLAFLLGQTAMIVVSGRLADRHGRKPVMLLGTGVFIAGSVLAGAAWSTAALIASRLIQGTGAGAMQPVIMTIVADLYSGFERCKFQGCLTSIWATAVVLGPLVGDLIVDRLTWNWIFWLSVPIGVVALVGFSVLPDQTTRSPHRPIDVTGAALFVIATASLVIALTEWTRPSLTWSLLAGGLFGACSLLFAIRQMQGRREPIVPLSPWSMRPVAAVNCAMLLAGMAFAGMTTLVPVYTHGILGQSSLVASLVPTIAMLGWPPGAMLAIWINHHLGLRQAVIAGSVLVSTGAAILVLLTPQSSPVAAGFGSFAMGAGMSLLSLSSLVLLQGLVGWSQRCSVIASNLTARNLGNLLGTTILGTTLSYHLGRSSEIMPPLRETLPAFPDAPLGIASLDRAGLTQLVYPELQQSLHFSFWAALLLSLGAVLAALRIPVTEIGSIPDDHSE